MHIKSFQALMTLNIYKYFNNDKIFIKVIALFYIYLKTFTRERPITDELKQLASAKNFIEGFNGCYKYFDGSHIILISSFQWPLFYRFISLPFVYFINNNIVVIYILKVISIIFLFLSLRFLFKRLFSNELRNLALNISILFIAFSIAPFNYGSTIDIASVSVFIFTVSFSFKYFFENQSKKTILAIFLLIILLINMRYAYLAKAIAILIFIFSIDLYKKTLKTHLLLKIILSAIVFVNVYLIYISEYFQSTSNNIVFNANLNVIESYWHMLYALFVIPFFPDFIIFNFLNKLLGEFIINNYLLFVTVAMLISGILFYFISKNMLKSLKRFTFKSNYVILMLAYGVLLNLMLIVAIYGLKYFYTIEKINNVYSFIYGGIAIYNRYLMLSSVCLFIICLYFAIEQNVKLLKSLFLLHCCLLSPILYIFKTNTLL